MSRWLLCLILPLCLAGCQSRAATKLPYDAWYLGFLAPNYMQVWLERANISDINGQSFPMPWAAWLRWASLPTYRTLLWGGLRELVRVLAAI